MVICMATTKNTNPITDGIALDIVEALRDVLAAESYSAAEKDSMSRLLAAESRMAAHLGVAYDRIVSVVQGAVEANKVRPLLLVEVRAALNDFAS